MSNQPQAAPNASEPRLCKMGCGFFGSGATGDCCSKCWSEQQKKAEEAAVMECKPVTESSSPMEIDDVPAVPATKPEEITTSVEKTVSADAAPAKKKKKKANYKNMMAGMMKSNPTRDVEKEKEQLRKVTGGGAFSKIDKI